MQTAIIKNDLVDMKFLCYLFDPKLIGALLFIDFTGVLNFISKYVFADTTYLKFLMVACIIDLVTGVTKVAITKGVKAVTSRGLRDTVTKIISYGSFLIIIHVLTHYEINGQASTSLMWLNKSALEFLIMVEIKSVYENIVAINPSLDFIDSVFQKVVNTLKNKKNENK